MGGGRIPTCHLKSHLKLEGMSGRERERRSKISWHLNLSIKSAKIHYLGFLLHHSPVISFQFNTSVLLPSAGFAAASCAQAALQSTTDKFLAFISFPKTHVAGLLHFSPPNRVSIVKPTSSFICLYREYFLWTAGMFCWKSPSGKIRSFEKYSVLPQRGPIWTQTTSTAI